MVSSPPDDDDDDDDDDPPHRREVASGRRRNSKRGLASIAQPSSLTASNRTDSSSSSSTPAMISPILSSSSPPARPTAPPPPAFPAIFKAESDQELIRLALHKSPFFTCLDEEQIDRLVSVAVLKTFRPGEIVIMEGCQDDDDDDDENDGSDDTLADIDDGDEFGERHHEDNDERAEESGPPYDEVDDDDDDDPLLVDHDEPSDRATVDAVDEDRHREEKVQRNTYPNQSNQKGEIREDEDQEPTTIRDPVKDIDPQHSVNFPEQHAQNGPYARGQDRLHNDSSHDQVDDHDHDDDSKKSYWSASWRTPISTLANPPPPQSGRIRSIYIVRKGRADVWYKPNFNPASLGPGTLFGEGGFLFGRQHSASVVASLGGGPEQPPQPLECWVVDISTFRRFVLPSQNMSQLFHRYASQADEAGVAYMTMEEFVAACDSQEEENNNAMTTTASEQHQAVSMQDPLMGLRIANTYHILRNNKGFSQRSRRRRRIYLDDFCFFHLLMARPDPEVDIAFLLMDQRQTGQIYLEDLARFVEPVFPDLDLTSQFFQRYFGKNGTQSIRQQHFSQFLVDLQREMGKQAFLRAVEILGTPEGYLGPQDFVEVLKTACGWRLPEGVADRLESIYCHGPMEAAEAAAMASIRSGSLKRSSTAEATKATEASVLASMEQRENNLGDRYFAYGDFLAFQEVLSNLSGICNLIDLAQDVKKGPVSPDDFKVANRVMGLGGRLSRRQVDIIFALFDLDQDGYVSHEDTVSVCGVDIAKRLVAVRGRGGKLTFAPPPEYEQKEKEEALAVESGSASLWQQFDSFWQQLGLIFLSSSVGVLALFPFDLVKTRLMNQQGRVGGQRMYANALDCFRKVIRAEGWAAMYRGLIPQLIGVAPEKAIKLQVNSLLRQGFASHDHDADQGKPSLNLPLEMLAGACAGACQLLVTNPMEIVKIRLQIQGETALLLKSKGIPPPPPMSWTDVVRHLGFPGVYRGASACLMRDIPFSAIYFPTYAALKDIFVNRRRDNKDPSTGASIGEATPSDLLWAGTLAGVPAAYLTTPADVIKTRLQVAPRLSETTYAGITDCLRKIYQQEGLGAFFRGASMRVLRIAPQFGISLLAYETITHQIGIAAEHPPTNAPVDPLDYRTAFSARSIQPKAQDIDGWMRYFGLVRPPDSTPARPRAPPGPGV